MIILALSAYNTQASKDEQVIRGKKMSKERISAFSCASADGMHRHKLVVVGKSARPCALKNHMHTLPVHLLPLLSERE